MTVGDPRGIGPEIVTKALADPRVRERCDVVVVGPEGTVAQVWENIGVWTPESSFAEAGRLSAVAITRAVEMVTRGDVHGIVTAPIDKAALYAGGYDYPGHTEMLAALTDSRVAMMLASDKLRVVLATTHLALRDVPAALTRESILEAALVTRRGLVDWFDLADPRIALCALNPHGGDGGRFGDEDELIRAPAAQDAGIQGPVPADTVFVRAMRGEFDAVIAPYHDVGMTAIKVASFGSAVNVTLGLPFPRTSPDHGTALDIAGQNRANPSSMIAATLLCASIAARVPSSGGRQGYAGQLPGSRSAAHPSRGR
ncbi:MAG TPA: 4-hydroxythreonine-4-phosphate dehydrogenase PdxA [Gemmatimonadaceae bacterium]|nr:4-hydroxythreonine-4-phosphate dehydrogenase PdxA [Gemmatimonadaceae bacterium]